MSVFIYTQSRLHPLGALSKKRASFFSQVFHYILSPRESVWRLLARVYKVS